MPPSRIEREPTRVAFLRTRDDPAAIARAWQKLEDVVDVRGTGFQPGEDVKLDIDSIPVGTATAATDGSIETSTIAITPRGWPICWAESPMPAASRIVSIISSINRCMLGARS